MSFNPNTFGTNTRKPAALERFAVIAAAPCRFFTAFISSKLATKCYAQLHNTAAEPAASAVPLCWIEIDPTLSGSTTASGTIDFPCYLNVGATVALSSTPDTYTALAASNMLIVATFK